MRERGEFLAELGLDLGIAGEGVERPCGRGRGCLVALTRMKVRRGSSRSSGMLTRDQEGRNLVEDLFNAELLLRGNVLVHVRLDEETEQVLVLSLLEGSAPTRRFLLQDCLLLLTDELEADSSHGLLGYGHRLGLLIRRLFGSVRGAIGLSEEEYGRKERTIQRRTGIRPWRRLTRFALFALLKIWEKADASSLESSPNLRASKE